MGDNIAFVETFSIIGNNPSILGLQNDKFKHLDLRGGNIDELHSIPYYLLEEVKSTLESLVLSNNHFDKIGHTGVEYYEDIQNMSTNSMTMSFNIFPAMERLLSLELDSCKIKNIWIGAFDEFPKLEHLSLKHNLLVTVPAAAYLPSLQSLEISGLPQTPKQEFELFRHMFLDRIPNLKSLVFGHFRFASEIKRDVFRGLKDLESISFYDSEFILENGVFNELINLKEVSMANSDNVYFGVSIFNGSEFQLEKLNLSGVSLSQSCDDIVYCSGFEYIKILDLSDMGLASPSQCIDFSRLPFLEELDLSRNDISSWNVPLLHQNTAIKKLSLVAERQTIILTDAMIDDFNNTEIIDLTENSFVCNDEMIVRFYQLAKHKTIIGWVNGTGYACKNNNGESKTFLEIVQKGEEEADGCCPNDMTTLTPNNNRGQTIIIATIAAAVSAIVFGALITYYTYSNKWYIKFWLAKRRLHKDPKFKPDNMYLKYDAFVSYSNDDQKWVYEKLAKYLEGQVGLKLCLHERDFSAGLPITENIVQSLEQSRTCLIILSDGYATSDWCNFELNCAHQIFSEQNNRSIVVIILNEPSNEKLTKTMKYILKTRTYLEWKEEEKSMESSANTVFWKRLLQTTKIKSNDKIYTCKI